MYVEPLHGVPGKRSSINGIECVSTRSVKRRSVERRSVERRSLQLRRIQRGRLIAGSGCIDLGLPQRDRGSEPSRDLADVSPRCRTHWQRRGRAGRHRVEGEREGEARRRRLRKSAGFA